MLAVRVVAGNHVSSDVSLRWARAKEPYKLID